MDILLDIKQVHSNESVEEPSSANKRIKRRTREWALDGIDLDNQYLQRSELVAKTLQSASENGFLAISSPPGTGKTSLLQLIAHSLQSKTDCKAYFLNPTSKRKDADFNLFKYIATKTGVDMDERELSDSLSSGVSEVYLLFDEGHKYFGPAFEDFWEAVVKRRLQAFSGSSTKVIVIVSTTYHLTSDSEESPVAFRACNRMGIEDLRFTKIEANELFDLWSPEPLWTRYSDTLFCFTNGTGAQFAAGVNLIVGKLNSADHRADSQNGYTEEDLLVELIEGNEFMELLTRCYATKDIDRPQHDIIFDAIIATYKVDAGENSRKIEDVDVPVDKATEKPLRSLKRSGILLKSLQFASPAAARFYFSKIFPRASIAAEAPDTLADLVVCSVKEMSSKRLRTSRQSNGQGVLQTPKQAVFQQLFYEAIYLLLPLKYRIVAEFGTSAEMDGKIRTGELDFYIRNERKWALEILRDGDKITGHLNRIGGNYRNVQADEWLMVDCRMGMKRGPSKRENNLCSLVFSEDCRTCTCYMREDESPITINLRE